MTEQYQQKCINLACDGTGGGDVTNAENIGIVPGSVGFFAIKTGTILQFRSLLSPDDSLALNELADQVEIAVKEVGGAEFNGLTYTWPAAPGGAGTVLTNDGAGNLSWQPSGSPTPTVVNFPDSTTQEEIVGSLATDVSIFMAISLWMATGSRAMSYEGVVTADGTTVEWDMRIIPGANAISTVTLEFDASGGDIVLRFTGTGPGDNVRASYLVKDVFTNS